MSTLFPPAPLIALPKPIDPVRKQLASYSPFEERRRMEAAAKKFYDDFFQGRVSSGKMTHLFWYLITYTLEAYKLWFLYMVLLSEVPPDPPDSPGSSSSSSTLPVRSWKLAETSSRTGLDAFGGNRAMALRYRLEEMARSVRELAREGTRSLSAAERHLGARSRAVTTLKAAVAEATQLVEDFHKLKLDPNVEAATAKLEALHRKLTSAIETVRAAVRALESNHVSSSSSSSSSRRIDPALVGATDLGSGCWGILDPTLRATLNTRRSGLGDLFQDALERGTIPMRGTGDTGVKMKDTPEIKVRRDRLEAFHQDTDMRIQGTTITIRLLDGSTVKLITFNKEYNAH